MTLKSDLYSLGCVLYELITGAPPFDGDTAEDVMKAHVHTAPVIPAGSVPAPVGALLTQLLAKAARGRPPAARAVIRALEPFLPADWSTAIEGDCFVLKVGVCEHKGCSKRSPLSGPPRRRGPIVRCRLRRNHVIGRAR